MTKRTQDALVDLDRGRRRLPFMSASAFSAMIADIKTNGLPELATDAPGAMRNLTNEARRAVTNVQTDYGDMITTTHIDGLHGHRPFELEHLNAQAYVQYAYCSPS